jgi:hypothetical protein
MSCRPPLFWKRKFEPQRDHNLRALVFALPRRLHGEVKRKSSTWHMDETFVRIAGKWMCLFRAVDAHGQTVDFYLSETRAMGYGVIRLRFGNCSLRGRSRVAAASERAATVITGSNPITVTSNAGYARCKGHGRWQRRGR